MDSSRLKVSAEVIGVKTRSRIRFAIHGVGIAMLLLGAYNFLLAARMEAGTIGTELYYPIMQSMIQSPVSPLAEILLMAAGAIVVWIL